MARNAKRFEKGDYRLVTDLDALTDEELRQIPPALIKIFRRWWDMRHRDKSLSLPPCFSWAEEALSIREPVLERVVMHEELHRWEVRLMAYPKLSQKIGPCLGCRVGPSTAKLPEPLAWLAKTFGTTTLEPFTSGTAPWGRNLGEMLDADELLLSGQLVDEDLIKEGFALPPSSRNWVVLYEIDGDAVCADLEGRGTYWTGGEHSGEAFTDLQLSWTAAVQFILWRLIDHRKIIASDLKMMHAAVGSR